LLGAVVHEVVPFGAFRDRRFVKHKVERSADGLAIATLVVGDVSDAVRVEYDPVEMRGEALFLLDEKVISVAFEFGDHKIGDIHWSIVDTITRTAGVHEGIAVLGTSFGDDVEVNDGCVEDNWHFCLTSVKIKKCVQNFQSRFGR